MMISIGSNQKGIKRAAFPGIPAAGVLVFCRAARLD
jgi:hypothetical protein